MRALLLVATYQLGRLHHVLTPHEYLWLLTAWVVMCAVLGTRSADRATVERYLGGRRADRLRVRG